MPSQPFWHVRLDAILAQLRGLDAEYVDRQAIERIFGVGERRARQLMGGCNAIKVGNAMAIRRTSLLERLESASVAVSKSSRILNARGLDGHVAPIRQKLPPGFHLTEGELRVFFISPTELAAKLSAAAAAITADWDAFAAETRIASPPDGSAQQNTEVRPNDTAVKIAHHPGVPASEAADDGGDSRPGDRLATPAVDRPTRAHVAEEDSSGGVSLQEQYELFCLAKVKNHLRALPQAVRSQKFEETRSAIRRAAPQLRRNDLDEIAQRELESKIRLTLNLPSIEEFAASQVTIRQVILQRRYLARLPRGTAPNSRGA